MEKKLKIFLCEDETNLGNILVELLESHHYEVECYTDGEAGAKAFRPDVYDLCLLDVMMPIKDGFALAKEIRAVDPDVPIIFLTAMGQREDIHEGLRLGADDYMTKPFSMEELILRIEAVLRRSGRLEREVSSGLPEKIYLGSYVFDRLTHVLSAKLSFSEIEELKASRINKKRTEPLVLSKLVPIPNEEKMFLYKQKLTTKEYELLSLLCRFMNKPLQRSYALETIWKRSEIEDEKQIPTQRNMDVYVNKLRRMLELDPTIEIKNIHGKGYILIVPK